MNGRTNVGSGESKNVIYTLKTASGDTARAVLEGEEYVKLTATANDIRLGKKAVTEKGPIDGQNDIPQYHTTTGYVAISPNTEFKIVFESEDYEYTKLQAMTMPWNETIEKSVAVDRAVIENNVYNAGETTVVATVTKDVANKTISLGITNGSEPAVIRYFTYREEKL